MKWLGDLRDKFDKPYPFTGDLRSSLKVIALIAVFVFFFVLFFVTGFIPAHEFGRKLLFSAYFGAVTLVIPVINTLIFLATIPEKMRDNWTVKHEIGLYMIQVSAIAVGNFAVTELYGLQPFTIVAFVESCLTTVFVATIPVSVSVLIEERKRFKKYAEMARVMNTASAHDRDETRPAAKVVEQNIVLEIDEETRVAEREILYIESDKNYVRVKLVDGGEHRVRSTLKDLLERNTSPRLLRVHRAFIVNVAAIASVDGNAQGLKLQLKNVRETIPVSRTYIDELKSCISLN